MQAPLGKKPIQKAVARKRPRRIWSCLECRRKKLQCDHGQPACGRCTRAGQAETCQYSTARQVWDEKEAEPAPDVSEVLARGGVQPNLQTSNDALVQRLDTLEKTLRELRRPAVPTPEATPTEVKHVPDKSISSNYDNRPYQIGAHPFNGEPSRSCLRGASFRTKFNGKTCTETLVEHVPGLSSFTSDAFANFSAFEQAAQYLNRTETRTRLCTVDTSYAAEDGLRTLLPPRDRADRLKQVYFDSFDFIFPVLHAPTFENQYSQLWLGNTLDDGRSTVLVLIVMAIAYCLTPDADVPGEPRPEGSRDMATLLLDNCDIWLRFRVQMFTCLIDFQISFLFLLARQLNARRCKRTWASAGSVLRTFQCSGLHREPDSLSKETTKLDKAMRRKLWAAAAEFELQAAFEHGMPAVPWRGQADIDPPVNANDDSVEPHSAAVYTKASFLAVAGHSLKLRHQLNELLNDMNQALPFDQAQWYTQELQNCLQAIPDSWMGPSAAAARSLLTITLHQYILAIHEQQLRLSTSPVERHFSRIALIESSVQSIDSHKAAIDSGSHLVELLCGDHVRAVLSMCLAYISADPVADRILLSAFNKVIVDAIAQAISLHSDKVVYLGGSRVQLWLLSAAEGVMRCHTHAGERAVHMQRAVDQFWRPFNQLIQRANAGVDTGSHAQEQVASVEPQASWSLDERQILDDLTGWTFDDFCFDFNDFMQSGAAVGV